MDTPLPPPEHAETKITTLPAVPSPESSPKRKSTKLPNIPDDKPKLKKAKRKARCSAEGCQKKLGLSPLECRCKESFCEKHRYPSQHNCQFDHQKRDREMVSSSNIKCVADKVKDRV